MSKEIIENLIFKGFVERDKKNYKDLKAMGIKVVVIWECEIKKMVKDEKFLEDFLHLKLNEFLYTDK